MSAELIAELEKKINAAAEGLAKVTSRKMFGCHALWADDNVFALVWKKGRLGVKLPDEAKYESLLGLKGSEPWKAGPMTMAHWVLVPESMHSKSAELRKWVTTAHGLCIKLEKKAKKPAKKKTKK